MSRLIHVILKLLFLIIVFISVHVIVLFVAHIFKVAVYLYYLTVDLNSGVVKASLLYENVLGMMETAFVGSDYTDVNGVQTFKSYTVGYAKSFETNSASLSYRADTGIVLSTIRDTDSCLKVVNGSFQIPTTNFAGVTLENHESQFGTSSLPSYFRVRDDISFQIWQLNAA